MYKWCTYSWYNKDLPQYIGKAFDIRDTSCNIQYSEGQLYAKAAWDMNYVKTFSNLESAIIFMLTNSEYKYLSEVKEMVTDKFTEDAKNVRWVVIPRYMKMKKLLKK